MSFPVSRMICRQRNWQRSSAWELGLYRGSTVNAVISEVGGLSSFCTLTTSALYCDLVMVRFSALASHTGNGLVTVAMQQRSITNCHVHAPTLRDFIGSYPNQSSLPLWVVFRCPSPKNRYSLVSRPRAYHRRPSSDKSDNPRPNEAMSCLTWALRGYCGTDTLNFHIEQLDLAVTSSGLQSWIMSNHSNCRYIHMRMGARGPVKSLSWDLYDCPSYRSVWALMETRAAITDRFSLALGLAEQTMLGHTCALQCPATCSGPPWLNPLTLLSIPEIY